MIVRHDLAFLFVAGLLGAATGCIIINDDDGGSETGNDTGPATSGPATSGPATSDSGSDSSGSGSAATASDETAAGMTCGWGPTGDPTVPEGYVCGGDGEDPNGDYPMLCPDGVTLEVGGACSGIEGPGCCDAEGNAWYCGDEGSGPVLAILEC